MRLIDLNYSQVRAQSLVTTRCTTPFIVQTGPGRVVGVPRVVYWAYREGGIPTMVPGVHTGGDTYLPTMVPGRKAYTAWYTRHGTGCIYSRVHLSYPRVCIQVNLSYPRG